MQTIIPATTTTPKITIDKNQNFFSFEGESFPEDVKAFFDPIMTPIEAHLRGLNDTQVKFEFFLTYFNSASTKVFFNLFNLLEEVSEFNLINVDWKFHAEDDTAEEFGKEFQEDLLNVNFNFIAI